MRHRNFQFSIFNLRNPCLLPLLPLFSPFLFLAPPRHRNFQFSIFNLKNLRESALICVSKRIPHGNFQFSIFNSQFKNCGKIRFKRPQERQDENLLPALPGTEEEQKRPVGECRLRQGRGLLPLLRDDILQEQRRRTKRQPLASSCTATGNPCAKR